MIEVKDKVKRAAQADLKKNFIEACKDDKFKRLVKTVKCSEEVAMKYTSSLQDTVEELSHCDGCKGLAFCQNRVEGYVYFPTNEESKITFSYAPCKYTKQAMKKEKNSEDKELATAKMADIDISDKNRVRTIKWLTTFCKQYDTTKKYKGLYLHGNFGCGKTYLISAAFNELSKQRVQSEIVYFPDLLREIKGDFETFADKMEYLKEVDLLLIDDIGAEKVTEWSRDEVLGTILQSRMNNYKATFFTSNLTIEELERHLTMSSYSDDAVKARRIIERIKQLTEDIEMISENRRK